MKAYLQPSLKDDFAHYVVRRSILQAVESFLPLLHGTVVDLGSGNMPYKTLVQAQPAVTKYVSVDWDQTIYTHQRPDLVWDGKALPLPPASVDCLLLTEVLEHLDEPLAVLTEVFRVLKPGGLLAGTTPFVWPLHEVPHDRQRFTPYGIEALLRKSGFAEIDLLGSGGWRTALAQFLCAYVGFGIKSPRRQAVAKRLLSRPVKFLVKGDGPVRRFGNTDMVSATVFKAQRPT